MTKSKTLYTFQNILFKTIQETDEEDLIHLLRGTRNKVDLTIDSKLYDMWSKYSIQVAVKDQLSVILHDRDSGKIIAYMIFRDYTSKPSREEEKILSDPKLKNYSQLMS